MAKTVKKKPVVSRPKVKKPVKTAPKPKAPKQEWATKDDLRPLAAKSALARLATKDELAGFATRQEIAKLPSPSKWQDLDQRMAKLEKSIETLDKKIELLASQQGDHPAALNRIHAEIERMRESVAALESKASDRPSSEMEIIRIENQLGNHETRLQNLEGVQ
jgi:septal ring factor EnvC (AmiA/AmiB activator)